MNFFHVLRWVNVKDPTRIPALIAELQAAWEAQPNLPLPRLLHELQAAGMSPTSTDEDFSALLQHRLATHPGFITDVNLTHRTFTVETTNPSRRVILAHHSATILPLAGNSAYVNRNGSRAQKLISPINQPPPATPVRRAHRVKNPSQNHTLKRARQSRHRHKHSEANQSPRLHDSNHATTPPLQPTAWTFSTIRSCRVSHPLVLVDNNDIPHHLGVVTSITAADFPADLADIERGLLPTLSGPNWSALSSSDLPGQEWLFRCADGSLVYIGRWLVVFSFRRRDLTATTHTWTHARIAIDDPATSYDQEASKTGPETSKTLVIHLAEGGSMRFSPLDWAIRVR